MNVLSDYSAATFDELESEEAMMLHLTRTEEFSNEEKPTLQSIIVRSARVYRACSYKYNTYILCNSVQPPVIIIVVVITTIPIINIV